MAAHAGTAVTIDHGQAAHDSARRLALVLGDGGIRSAAAIGIGEVLARAGMAPDLVVGCGAGAVFGAAVALGMPSQAALRLSVSLWSRDLMEQTRWGGYLQWIAPRWTGFGEGFALRSDHLIARRLETAFGRIRLEELATPLRVAATDARSGVRVTLTRGLVARALQASVAVPLWLPSVQIGGRRLRGGVVSDPLPLAAAEDAAVVVALGFRAAMPQRIDRASRLAARAATTMINNLHDARLDAARARGQGLIQLALDLPQRVGAWDASALPAAYLAGGRAALAALPAIERALASAAAPRKVA